MSALNVQRSIALLATILSLAAEACHPSSPFDTAKQSTDGIDMNDYQIPDYNITDVKSELVSGNGFVILRNVFSKADILVTQQQVQNLTKHNRIQTNVDENPYAKHNSYGGKASGIVWRLLGNGRIFEKIAMHPTLKEITIEVLGESSYISSYMSNTVAPGMKGQTPHIDYPYYDGFFPNDEKSSPRPLLSIGIMIMVSEFSKENGGTAARPGSQRSPTYPSDKEEFFRHAVQFEGKPGDVAIFAASLQHCAMPNNSPNHRVGIVMSMIPGYLRAYQDIRIGVYQPVSSEFKKMVGMGHYYPMRH